MQVTVDLMNDENQTTIEDYLGDVVEHKAILNHTVRRSDNMQAEAIVKLNAEIEANKKHPYIQIIGQFLISHINANPNDAIRLMAADKSIEKSLKAMESEARKKQHKGMAILTDAEGFAIVLKYFEIGTQAASSNFVPSSDPVTAAPEFDVKLEDFI